jgi:thiol-disulfide isomerase/thioredoxin
MGFTTILGGYPLIPFFEGHIGKFVIVFFLYLFVTMFIRRRYQRSEYVLLAILLFPIAVSYGFLILDNPNIMLLAMLSTAAYYVGPLVGWAIAHRTRKAQVWVLSFVILVVVWFVVYGSSMLLHYDNYGSVYGNIDPMPVPETIVHYASQEDAVKLKSKEGLLIMDFWNNGCGVCFKKFPEFEQLYQSYQHRDDIQFYAVNVAIREGDEERARQTIAEWDYTFPNLLIKDKIFADKLGVELYPTLLIIRNDSIVYKGNLENISKFIQQYDKQNSKK